MVQASNESLSDPRPAGDLLRSTDGIRYQEFNLARKGYEPDEVTEYLAQLADWIDELKREVIRLSTRATEIDRGAGVMIGSADGDPYEELGSRVASIVRSSDEYGDRIRAEADRAAERKLAEADRAAETKLADAAQQAAEVIRSATQDGERIRSEADQQVAEARDEAEKLVSRVRPLNAAALSTVTGLQTRLREVADEMEHQLATLSEAGPPAAETAAEVDPPKARGTRPALKEEWFWSPSARPQRADDDIVELPDVATAGDQDSNPSSN